jgi:hypothetical protein
MGALSRVVVRENEEPARYDALVLPPDVSDELVVVPVSDLLLDGFAVRLPGLSVR